MRIVRPSSSFGFMFLSLVCSAAAHTILSTKEDRQTRAMGKKQFEREYPRCLRLHVLLYQRLRGQSHISSYVPARPFSSFPLISAFVCNYRLCCMVRRPRYLRHSLCSTRTERRREGEKAVRAYYPRSR